jgi:hypothetical protein
VAIRDSGKTADVGLSLDPGKLRRDADQLNRDIVADLQ